MHLYIVLLKVEKFQYLKMPFFMLALEAFATSTSYTGECGRYSAREATRAIFNSVKRYLDWK